MKGKGLAFIVVLLGLCFTAAQAQSPSTNSNKNTRVIKDTTHVKQTGMNSYISIMPYYLRADRDRGLEHNNGTGIALGYGHHLTGGLYGEGQLFSGLLETGHRGMSDYYQYGFGVDLMYRFFRQAPVSPFVLGGIGGIYDDVVAPGRDGMNFYGNGGVGIISGPLTDGGLRIRAGARYIWDSFKNDRSDGMGDVRFSIGLVIPLGRKVVEHTIVRERTRTRVQKVVRTQPIKDSDGDGVPDRKDDCPNTLKGALVDNHGCAKKNQKINLQGVKFKFNKAVLTANARVILRTAVKAMIGQPDMKVEIMGYTDSVGAASYNLKLSRKRAQSVKTFLVNHGIRTSRLTTVGYGEAHPIASNDTKEGRQKNRRVVFRILGN